MIITTIGVDDWGNYIVDDVKHVPDRPLNWPPISIVLWSLALLPFAPAISCTVVVGCWIAERRYKRAFRSIRPRQWTPRVIVGGGGEA